VSDHRIYKNPPPMIFHFVSISEYHHVAIISNLASGYQKFLAKFGTGGKMGTKTFER